MSELNELSKEELEKRKLASEVKVLNRPFIWKNFNGLAAIIFTASSLFVGFYTKFFDYERTKSEIEFKDRRKVLQDSINDLVSNLSIYRDRISVLESNQLEQVENKQQVDDLSKKSTKLSGRLTDLENQNLEDNAKISELTRLLNDYENVNLSNIRIIDSLTLSSNQAKELLDYYSFVIESGLGTIKVQNDKEGKSLDIIKGKVLDQNGIAINDASVHFHPNPHGPYDKTTNKAGTFFLQFTNNKFNQGRTFPVTISKEGYKTVEGNIVVGSNVIIRLEKKGG